MVSVSILRVDSRIPVPLSKILLCPFQSKLEDKISTLNEPLQIDKLQNLVVIMSPSDVRLL